MKHLFVIKYPVKNFDAGQIVEASEYSFDYKNFITNTITVTNYKVIGVWPCCKCNKYYFDTVSLNDLEYLGPND